MDEGFFRAIFAAVPCPILVSRSSDGQIVAANPAYEAFAGQTDQEILGRRPCDSGGFIQPEDWPRLEQLIVQSGCIVSEPLEAVTATGSRRHVLLSAKVYEIGGTQYCVMTIPDITSQRLAEQSRARNEQRLRETLDATCDAIFIHDETGRVLDVNEHACVMFGCDRDRLLNGGLNACSLGVAPYSEVEGAEKVRLALTEGTQVFEWRSRRADGQLFWTEVALRPCMIGDDRRILATVHDITQLKETAQELDRSRRMLQMVLENVPGLVFWKGLDCAYLGCNSAFARYAGLVSPEEIAGKTDFDMPWKDTDADLIRGIDQQILRSGVSRLGYLQSAADAGGRVVHFRMNKVAMRDAEGRIIGILGTAEDITEEKRITEERELARELLEAAIAQSPSGILVADAPHVKIRLANAAAIAIRDADTSALTGIEVGDHSPRWQTFLSDGTPYPSEELPLSRAVLKGELTRGESVIIRDREGKDHWVDVNAAPVRDAAGKIRAGIVVFHDVTELKKAELALRASEEKYRGIAERSSEIIYHLDSAGNVTYASPAIAPVLGYRPEEVLGRNFQEFIHEGDRQFVKEKFAHQIAHLAPQKNRFRLIHKTGRSLTVDAHSGPIVAPNGVVGVQGAIHDITAESAAEERLRNTEEQLSHLARLSTLGEMIAGIAHELSHPLYVIHNLAQACRNVLDNRPEDEDELCDWCSKIAAAATQAGAVVRTLREFSRRSEFHCEPSALHDVLQEAIALLQYEARRHQVTLELDLDGPSPTVNVDRIRIQQVLVNLVRNACEALSASQVVERRVRVRARVADGRVLVSVSDNGPGLPAHLGTKIFEPFVSTKSEGLGLGLSISATIVEGHDSKLQIASNAQGGATLQFELPIVS